MKKIKILSSVLLLVFLFTTIFIGCKKAESESTTAAQEAAGESAASSGKTLNMLSWYDEAVDKTFTEFEAKFGVKINFTLFESNEEGYTKLKTDPSAFDIIQGDGLWPIRYFDEGLTQEWDPTGYSSWNELNPDLRKFALEEIWKGNTPNNTIAYPGSTGVYCIIARKDKVPEGINSWADLWDPKFKGKIAVTPQGNEMIAMTALGMGYELDSEVVYNLKGDDLKKVEARLLELKPNTRMVWSSLSEAAGALEQEEVWIAIVYAKTPGFYVSKDGIDVWNIIPKEGTLGWINATMITAATKNKKECEEFINFLYSKEARMNRWTQMEKWDHMVDLNSEFVKMLKSSGDEEYVTYMEMDNPGNAIKQSTMMSSPNDVASYVAVWNNFMTK